MRFVSRSRTISQRSFSHRAFLALAGVIMESLTSGMVLLVVAGVGLSALAAFFGGLLWLTARFLPVRGMPIVQMAFRRLQRRGGALVFALIALWVLIAQDWSIVYIVMYVSMAVITLTLLDRGPFTRVGVVRIVLLVPIVGAGVIYALDPSGPRLALALVLVAQ